MLDERKDPEELLRMVNQEEEKPGGRLKIFFGYSAGVGKTYAMLEAAHAAKRSGIDVVAGYIEPHVRPETLKLAEGLERLPDRTADYQGMAIRELDLDAAIRRRPQLILVDELAHTNAPGSRHQKRYQDVQELLRAGIDVYTTVNVQHIESLNNVVASITGVMVRERIPDFVFDSADQVELVDIEPQDLIGRMKEGKVYRGAQAERAMDNFFTLENLTALREVALRRTADRVNRISERKKLLEGSGDYTTAEHILICLSPSPSNAKVIREAARMAAAFHAKFTALFVETPDFGEMEKEDLDRLRGNLHLAEQLGATAVTSYGSNVVEQIAEYAKAAGVSKIVLGRSYTKRPLLSAKESFTDRLIRMTPNLEVFLIPDSFEKRYLRRGGRKRTGRKRKYGFIFSDLTKFLSILAGAVLISHLFRFCGFSDANINTIFILGVLLTALTTGRRIYSVLAPLASILAINFFFTDPLYTFKVSNPDYIITFIVMFLAAFIMAALTKKVKEFARVTAQKAYRTEILLETSQKLQQAKGKREIIQATAGQLTRLLEREVIFYPDDPGLSKGEPMCFPEDLRTDPELVTDAERGVASWVYQNNKHAGASTTTLPGAKCLYLAVRSGSMVFAVVGIDLRHDRLNSFEESLMSAVLNECALALSTDKMEREKNEAAAASRQEKLRADLLRSISHDLRTPLTSISGNAEILISSSGQLGEEQKQRLYLDMYDDSMWLINLVENLLSVTRIENGSMELRLQPELAEDVIAEALRHCGRKSKEHVISSEVTDDLLMARMDSKLMIQVILNLVDNAVKYTPPGSHIKVSARREGGDAVFEVSDDGAGIADENKEKIFEMFFTENNPHSDSRRGMGLGLSLCKSIVEAHGGRLSVRDNLPHGAVFQFHLKAEEVSAQ